MSSQSRNEPGPNPVAAGAAARRHVEHDMLLAALPHPILVVGEAERIVYANQAAEQFFSMSIAVMRRQTLREAVGFGCPLVALVDQVRRSGASVNEYGIDIALPRIEGSRLVDIYAGPVPEQGGLTIVMIQQRSMAQMIERHLTHRTAARTVSGMAAVLAHEIKNPLSGIRGAAQLLEPGLGDEDRALAQLICSETDRIRNLVDRMEVFGDERPLQLEPVNIHAVLDHVCRLAQAGFASSIPISAEYDPSLPPVAANRDKLIQAFLNLLKNAAEAVSELPEPGRIILRTAFRPGVRMTVPGTTSRVALPLMIEIEDTGIGVPEHIKQQLFDPFVTTKTRGSGLGLALVGKIIRDHGGVIEFESERRHTVFRVLLPLQVAGATGKGPQNG